MNRKKHCVSFGIYFSKPECAKISNVWEICQSSAINSLSDIALDNLIFEHHHPYYSLSELPSLFFQHFAECAMSHLAYDATKAFYSGYDSDMRRPEKRWIPFTLTMMTTATFYNASYGIFEHTRRRRMKQQIEEYVKNTPPGKRPVEFFKNDSVLAASCKSWAINMSFCAGCGPALSYITPRYVKPYVHENPRGLRPWIAKNAAVMVSVAVGNLAALPAKLLFFDRDTINFSNLMLPFVVKPPY